MPCVQVREWEECLSVLGSWDDADANAMDVQAGARVLAPFHCVRVVKTRRSLCLLQRASCP